MKKNNKFNRLHAILGLVFLTGCAGMSRDCASCGASNFGSDWVVVQYRMDGEPINCWKLQNIAIDNETNTDGIYWGTISGHLIHISGWYNRVQVSGGRFDEAAKEIGVDLNQCVGGKYLPIK